MSRDAFGPNLRRIRLQRQISIEQIATATKVSAPLLHGLEKNDFSLWPSGLYARSYVRQYAEAIGVDPDSTVDEFCRWFEQGDRRLQRTMIEHSEIVGHDNLNWHAVPPENQIERRGGNDMPPPREATSSHSPIGAWVVRLRRVLGRA
jgi:transcriptional regulator with XRE-family HTH domain